MVRTILIIAALAASAPAFAQTQRAPASPPAADRSNEVVCRDRAVTGSRFTHRRCQTRAQARTAEEEAQRFMRGTNRSSPSVEEIVNPMQRNWNPQ